MNLAKESKDLLKESKKALIKELELTRWIRGVKALATKPVYSSLIPGSCKSGRDLTHGNGMHLLAFTDNK